MNVTDSNNPVRLTPDRLVHLANLWYDTLTTLLYWVEWVSNETGKRFVICPQPNNPVVLDISELVIRDGKIVRQPVQTIPIKVAEQWFSDHVKITLNCRVPARLRSPQGDKLNSLLRLMFLTTPDDIQQ